MDDLKQLALELLETEKRYLLQDKREYYAAIAVVVTPDSRYFEEVEFDDEEGKHSAYAGVVASAREQNATAIITINTAREMSVTDRDDLGGYWWGRLEAEGTSRALVVTISGPGMKAWCMTSRSKYKTPKSYSERPQTLKLLRSDFFQTGPD